MLAMQFAVACVCGRPLGERRGESCARHHDRRTRFRVDDLHVGHVIEAKARGQQLFWEVADQHAHLFEDAVGIANAIDQLFFTRTPTNAGAGQE